MNDSIENSTAPQFRCPACRARQQLQTECRRCGADLSLLVKVHQRIDYLIHHRSDAHDKELRQLAPKTSGLV